MIGPSSQCWQPMLAIDFGPIINRGLDDNCGPILACYIGPKIAPNYRPRITARIRSTIFQIIMILIMTRGVRVEHFFGSGRVISIFFGPVPENFGYPKVFGYSNIFGYSNAFGYLVGYWNVFGCFNAYGGGGQNLERRNVERSIFQNFKIANIKMTKDELFDSLIPEIIIFLNKFFE